MSKFQGFNERSGKKTPGQMIPVPGQFFSQLLPEIDYLGELKLILYVFWRIEQMEGDFPYLRRADLATDRRFMQGLNENPDEAQTVLDEALDKAVLRGMLLRATVRMEHSEETLYFLNTPRSRAAVDAILSGKRRTVQDPGLPVEPLPDLPNIFQLYEENIGLLTPMLADTLREAETAYPAAWIEEAMRIAVENNVRRWRYVEAILNSWKEEGRDEQDRRDTEKDRRRYIEGKFAKFIEHG
jgi:DnaD/phage-associated family protein